MQLRIRRARLKVFTSKQSQCTIAAYQTRCRTRESFFIRPNQNCSAATCMQMCVGLSQCFPTFLTCYPKSYPDVGRYPLPPIAQEQQLFSTEMPIHIGCISN